MSLYEIIKNHCPAFFSDFVIKNDHIIEGISNYIKDESDKAESGTQNKVTPGPKMTFTAFQLVSFDTCGLFDNSLKVVIMLQDPYYQPGAAMGVAMGTIDGRVQQSVTHFIKRARETYKVKDPSKYDMEVNGKIINEVCEPDGTLVSPVRSGDIRGLCSQGVLMINAAMTTREGETRAHTDAWSLFSEQLVKWLSETFPFLVFIFLGRDAQMYSKHIKDKQKHAVICSSHPSGRGYYAGFHECDIFNETNHYLRLHHRPEIEWENYTYK